jgi:hypothetical protein
VAVGPWRGRGEEEVAAVVLAAAAGGEDERERWRFLLAVILLLLTDISRNDDLDSIAVLMYYLKLWILDTYRREYTFFSLPSSPSFFLVWHAFISIKLLDILELAKALFDRVFF